MFMHLNTGVNSKAPDSSAPSQMVKPSLSVVNSYETHQQHAEHVSTASSPLPPPSPSPPTVPSAPRMTSPPPPPLPVLKKKSCSDSSGYAGKPQQTHQEYERLVVTPEMLKTVSLKPMSERLLKKQGY